MEIKKLEKSCHEELKTFIKIIVENLPKKEWLIAPSNEAIENLFINNMYDYWGVFDNGKLLAISSLSFDKDDFLEIVKLLGIENNKVAEIAECMTLPEARGNNYMLQINKVLVERAKSMGIEYLIATAHPENIASNSSLKKLGMVVSGQFYRYGKYFRNYFIMKLTDNK